MVSEPLVACFANTENREVCTKATERTRNNVLRAGELRRLRLHPAINALGHNDMMPHRVRPTTFA